ncbi:MAG TPA: hypothetical protein VGN20_07990 [Mucilaginibacter sp.]|jgi:uncharacterized membrane protein
MNTQTFAAARPSYRTAGWAAIASGTIGIMAYVALVAYLTIRNKNEDAGTLTLRFHDTGVIIQFILMIPVASEPHKLLQQTSAVIGRATLVTGVGVICLTIVALVLIFSKVVSDTLYMFPLGIVGV